MRVLILDDDEALRELLATELSRGGHEVAHAPTAAAGVATAKQAEPDVVLLDLQLPDADGIEVLRRLRADRPDVEVVVLAAEGTIDAAVAAVREGAFGCVRKPCHATEVELALERAFERRELSRENIRLKRELSVEKPGPDAGGLLGQRRQALTLAEVERGHIARVLASVGGHRSRAAALLGISERNLYRKIHEHRLDLDGKEGGGGGDRGEPA